MTTQNFCGIKLRPIRTDFWRKKVDQTFYRGDLTGRLLTSPKDQSKSCQIVLIQMCLGIEFGYDPETKQGMTLMKYSLKVFILHMKKLVM